MKSNPVFVRIVEEMVEQAARAWARTTDGAIPEVRREAAQDECDRLTTDVDNLCRDTYGITVGWPGLYPTYTHNGYEFDDLARAIEVATEDVQ